MKKKLFITGLFFILCFVQNVTGQTNLKGLVVLIDFPDAPADSRLSISRVSKMMNEVGYTEPRVTTSVRDYWYAQSRGKVNLTHDVFGYFRAPNPLSYYRAKDWTISLELTRQAMNWVKATNPNYNWNSVSLSDKSNEIGDFLSVNFITTADIPGSGGTHYMGGWTAPNGKNVGQITSQQLSDNGDLFTIIHEQGHMVWSTPDSYDPDGSSAATGHYTVMSGNQNNGQIESFGAPFLAKQGWVDVIDLKPNTSYTLTQDGNSVARYVNPNDPQEYFMIEARMKSTLGNQMIDTERGLLIWHADEKVTTGGELEDMTLEKHYQYSIEQADGRFDLENGRNQRDGDDYFVEGNTFSDSTIPNTKWWNGQSSSLNINNIKFLPNNKISFNVGNPTVCSTCNPTLNFTRPLNNQQFAEGTPVKVDVNAADSNGSVTKVALYVDGVFIRDEKIVPYEWADPALSSLSAGSHTLKAIVTDNEGNTTEASIVIKVMTTNERPYAGTPYAIPGTIEAENFDKGGLGVGYNDTESANKGGGYRVAEGVDIENCSEGGFNVGWTISGEWLEYTVNVTTAGSYKIDTRVSSPSGGSFHINFGSNNVTGTVAVPNTGGWQNWQTVSKTVNLSAGQQIVRFAIDQGSFNFNKVIITSADGGAIVSGQIYRLVARHSGKVLDVSDCSLADGANVQQWPMDGTDCQKWKIEATDNGYYSLIAQQSGKALDVSTCGTADGQNVHQWEYYGGTCQQWKIEPTDNGYFRLLARNSGKALDVSGSSTEDGANVLIWPYHGGGGQQWKLEAVATQTRKILSDKIEKEPETSMSVYKGSNEGIINLQLNLPVVGKYKFLIYNLVGAVVYKETLNVNENQFIKELDLTQLKKGMYVLKFEYGDEVLTRKIML